MTRNGQEAASSTILLIDRLNTPPADQRYAEQKIVKFLETRRSQDRIGIYAFGNGLRVVQDLTDDPERLSEAIRILKPRDENHRTLHTPGGLDRSEPDMSGRVLQEYRSFTASEGVLDMKHAFEAIARHLAPVPGRKSLIWISDSFPLLIRTAHETKDFSPDMKEAARALNDANVALYAVDARGLVVGNFANPRGPWGLAMPGIDTMNDLAGLTGGRAFYADNGIDSLIEEAVEDSELIYTLGFYPSPESEDGDWHNLKVSVDRRGVSVRYRENYFASKASDAASHLTLQQLLNDTLDAAEIGLRAETTPDPSRPGVYKLRAIVDLHDVHLDHQDARWVGGVELSLYLEGEKSAYRITRKIAIPDAQLAAALEQGVVVDVPIGMPAPTGELRVVVQDVATGAGGSVRVPLGRK